MPAPATFSSSRLMIHRAWLLAGALLAFTLAGATEYRGFTIDDSRIRQPEERDAILASIRAQIDIVHAVGLPAETVAFMAKVRFELVPLGTFRSPTPGIYEREQGGRVQVSAAILGTGKKPVLLHELLHAYHDQVVADGFRNAEIRRHFEQAKELKVYAERSHMMKNDREFFACAATTFLNGVTAQEPFVRAKVREHQPDLHQFLQRLLGPEAGAYAGSLQP